MSSKEFGKVPKTLRIGFKNFIQFPITSQKSTANSWEKFPRISGNHSSKFWGCSVTSGKISEAWLPILILQWTAQRRLECFRFCRGKVRKVHDRVPRTPSRIGQELWGRVPRTYTSSWKVEMSVPISRRVLNVSRINIRGFREKRYENFKKRFRAADRINDCFREKFRRIQVQLPRISGNNCWKLRDCSENYYDT